MSILRIHNVSSRDAGEIRCTASVAGKGPSISCTAELQLKRSLRGLDDPSSTCDAIYPETRAKKGTSCTRSNSARRTARDLPPSPRSLRHEPPMRARSSSLPLKSVVVKRQSPSPAKRNVPPSPLLGPRRSIERKTISRTDLESKKTKDSAAGLAKDSREPKRTEKDKKVASSNEEEAVARKGQLSSKTRNEIIKDNSVENEDKSSKTPASGSPDACKTEDSSEDTRDSCENYDDTPIICMDCDLTAVGPEEAPVSRRNDEIEVKQELVPAAILKVPADVTVFRGNRVVLRVGYRGHPEPRVKWLRAVIIIKGLVS